MQLLSVNTAQMAGRTLYNARQKHAAGNRGCLWPGGQWHQEPGQTQRPTGLLGTTREQIQAGQHRVSHIASSAFWEQLPRGSFFLFLVSLQDMKQPTVAWSGSQCQLDFIYRRPE